MPVGAVAARHIVERELALFRQRDQGRQPRVVGVKLAGHLGDQGIDQNDMDARNRPARRLQRLANAGAIKLRPDPESSCEVPTFDHVRPQPDFMYATSSLPFLSCKIISRTSS